MDTNPLKLLIVDDEEAHIEAIRRAFAMDGNAFDVQAVHTLGEYRAYIATRLPDLVLMDLNLPDGRAIEVLSQPAGQGPFPILVMTAFGNQQIVVEVMKAGALDYVVKSPEAFAMLPRTVASALREWKLMKSHQQVEVAVRLSDERFRTFLHDVSSIAVQSYASDGTTLYWNHASEHLYGYTEKEAMGQNLIDLIIPPEMREEVKRNMQLIARTGKPIPAEALSLMRKDGSRVAVFSSHSIVNIPGREPQLFCLDIDLTDLKKAEESRARLATAVDQAAETILITDINAVVLYANPAFEKTTGYKCEEIIGKTPGLLHSGKQDPEFYRQMWSVLSAGKAWTGRLVNKRKDGALIEEDACISPVFDAAGKIVNYVGVKRDVTRELQLEQQFLHAQKMEAIGRLAGSVAHDFNNILAVILMNASELRQDETLAPELSSGLAEIVLAAERGASLTRQMLAFSHRQILQMQLLSLNEVVTGMNKMLQRLIGADVVLQIILAEEDVTIRGDAGMIEQILMNLIVNARDAMSEGGQISIAVDSVDVDADVASVHNTKPGNFARLTVRDTGSGIPPEHLPHIFEPFYTTKDAGKGTGLGLATVHGIVSQHHGWIEVESQVGQGATFQIYLPRLQVGSQVRPDHHANACDSKGHETILLVEDEQSLRSLVARILRHSGYVVLEAANGVAAIETWDRHRDNIDMLLTDVVMPGGISGGNLANKFRTEKPGLKVLCMSGYPGESSVAGLGLNGNRHFLQKPFPPTKLVQTVRECLDGAEGLLDGAEIP